MKYIVCILIFMTCIVMLIAAGFAVNDENNDTTNWENVEPDEEGIQNSTGKSVGELTQEMYLQRDKYRFWTIIALCVASFVSLIVVLMMLSKTSHEAGDIVNASGLNFIIFGTILLVIIADAEVQLTAAIGILGAVAGYLFGTFSKGQSKSV